MSSSCGIGCAPGASGQITLRADSGFYTHAVVAVCRKLLLHHHPPAQKPAHLPADSLLDGQTTPAGLAPVRLIQPTPGSQLALSPPTAITASSAGWNWRPTTAATPRSRYGYSGNSVRPLRRQLGWPSPDGLFPGPLDRASSPGPEQIVTTKWVRRRFFSLAGGTRLTLHLGLGKPRSRPGPAARPATPSLTTRLQLAIRPERPGTRASPGPASASSRVLSRHLCSEQADRRRPQKRLRPPANLRSSPDLEFPSAAASRCHYRAACLRVFRHALQGIGPGLPRWCLPAAPV